MKKVFLLVASAMLATGAFAVQLPTNVYLEDPQNPNSTLNYVAYDCATGKIGTLLAEFDQDFTFAVDLTGTTLLDWINGTAPAGATRGAAFVMWYDGNNGINLELRLVKIKNNIYGATFNLKHLQGNGAAAQVINPTVVTAATTSKAVFYGHGVIIGFAYNATNDGVEWWANSATVHQEIHFKTAEYTGKKTVAAWAGDEAPYDNPTIFAQFGYDGNPGYAAPCVAPETLYTTGIGDVTADGKTIVGYFSILGVKLNNAPASGIFIEKYSDGTSAKIVK